MHVVSPACSIEQKNFFTLLILDMQKFCQMDYKLIKFSHWKDNKNETKVR